MKAKNEVRVSLYMEWFLLMLFAGMISLMFFIGSRFLFEQQIDKHYRNRNVVRANNEKYMLQLQNYIKDQEVSSKDLHKLDAWMKENRLIYIQIRKNNEWIYSSDYYIDEMEFDAYDLPTYPEDGYYNMDLTDGAVQVFVMGMYSYNAYIMALVLDIIVSLILFLTITMFGIRRKIHYINQLSRDIEILEGGNLDYEVHVWGNDEITEMAKGLNAMKISFHNQIEEVECLTKTNQEMVTEISHDLRTPLTSVLLYAEILRNEKYRTKEDKQDILDKMIKKIQHMKDLSDGLLTYAIRASEEKYIPADYMSVHSALYDELSDMCQYLQEQGVQVKVNMQWQMGQILVYQEYLTRIMDNISSNILKYADRQAGISIWDEYYMDEMCIICENACIKGEQNPESYQIGIRNVRTMVKEMGGSCDVTQSDEMFQIYLRFKFRREE